VRLFRGAGLRAILPVMNFAVLIAVPPRPLRGATNAWIASAASRLTIVNETRLSPKISLSGRPYIAFTQTMGAPFDEGAAMLENLSRF
jgi:hypothetical protein